MKYTSILWDFNGTIIDDVEAGIKSVNTLLHKRGLKVLPDVGAYREVFCFPIIRYYSAIGFDLDAEPFEKIAIEWVEQYLLNCRSAGVRAGAVETLDFFAKHGIKQYIISATELSMLSAQIKDYGLGGYFEEIYGLDNIHAYSKKEAAKRWRCGREDERALFIGDTLHDLEVAQSIGSDCILVCGGHQSERILRESGARVAVSFAELKNIIK